MLKQLAVFVENETGSLRRVTRALVEHDINIYASTSVDTPEFGILRMIVDDADKAKEFLTTKGFVTKVGWVIAVELSEEVGGFDRLLDVMARGNVNINYTYSSFGRESNQPVVILNTDEIYETESMLTSNGFACLDSLQ